MLPEVLGHWPLELWFGLGLGHWSLVFGNLQLGLNSTAALCILGSEEYLLALRILCVSGFPVLFVPGTRRNFVVLSLLPHTVFSPSVFLVSFPGFGPWNLGMAFGSI